MGRTSVILLYLVAALIDTGSCTTAPKFKVVPNWPDRTYYDEDGPPIQLDCFIQDGINFTMVWTKDGNSIQPARDQLILLNSNQSLVFEVPKQSQSGLYECMAYNDVGNVSHSGNILITARKQETRPRVTDTHPSTTISRTQLGDTVNISCTFDVGGSAEALMDLTLNWYKDDLPLSDNNHTIYGLNSTGNNDQVSSLTISKIQKDDYGTYRCYGENSKGNDSELISVVPPLPQNKNAIPLMVIIGSSVGGFVTLVVVAVVGMVLRRRYTTSNTYDELEWAEPDDYDVPERKIEYDVFISYSSDDLDWVKDELFENLCNHSYNVCIDFKDFTPGMAIAENIIDAIYKSHKTIVLMSHQFLKSLWGQFELQQAHNRTLLKRSDNLVLIKYDDCKVPSKFLGKTFLDWSDIKVRPHFWTRLFEAIGEPGSFVEHVDDNEDNDKDKVKIANPTETVANTTHDTNGEMIINTKETANVVQRTVDEENNINEADEKNYGVTDNITDDEINYDKVNEDIYEKTIEDFGDYRVEDDV